MYLYHSNAFNNSLSGSTAQKDSMTSLPADPAGDLSTRTHLAQRMAA
jgi:hypothetical protein